jgi:hypothetical protein
MRLFGHCASEIDKLFDPTNQEGGDQGNPANGEQP